MGWLALDEVSEALTDPPEGKQQLPGHDKTYGEIRDGFDSVRDACNKGIDKVNGWLAQAGRSEQLPRLREESLDHYVVYPLSGDYLRIQQNASACGILRDGMTTWAGNFETLAVNSVLAFKGRANGAFQAQLMAYNLVMRGVGTVVKSGSVVFDSIARVSEKIAIQIENVLIEMGKRLLKLAKVVGKRFLGGWASAALLIKDLAEHGLSVITDVVDDVKWCIAAIDKCFTIKEEVEAWAATQAERIEKFKEIVALVRELPQVDLGTPLHEVKELDLGPIKDAIKGYDPDFGQTEDGEDAEDGLDETTDDLVDGSGYEHPSWAENCVTPPPGMGHLPYVPGDPGIHDVNPLTGLPTDSTRRLDPPVPGESSKAYYAMYEKWRRSLRPPLYAPPAEGHWRGWPNV